MYTYISHMYLTTYMYMYMYMLCTCNMYYMLGGNLTHALTECFDKQLNSNSLLANTKTSRGLDFITLDGTVYVYRASQSFMSGQQNITVLEVI